MEWQPISTAPKDGTRIIAKRTEVGSAFDARRLAGKLYTMKRKTWWGKTSHLKLFGWCYGRYPENVELWLPTHWIPTMPADPTWLSDLPEVMYPNEIPLFNKNAMDDC